MKLLSLLLSITLAVTQNVDSIVNQSIQSGDIPGAVVCYVENDSIVFIKAYGNRSIIPSVEAMTTQTVFDLASVSKTKYKTLFRSWVYTLFLYADPSVSPFDRILEAVLILAQCIAVRYIGYIISHCDVFVKSF